MMKVALINVRFSPNLGDGLLSECLEAELARRIPGASFVSIDLAGRTNYGQGSSWRKLALRLLMRMPACVRRRLARIALLRLAKRLEPRFSQALGDCDVAILGGGNLLSDADLNFPVKVATALGAAGARLPVAVFAVGVSRNWSEEGTRLFRKALTGARLVHVSVRDRLSHDALLGQLPGIGTGEVDIVSDPGLLASRHFPAAQGGGEQGGDERPVGICITHPLALRYHGGSGGSGVIAHWFGELIGQLVGAGRRIRLFTNGSPEDASFLAAHAPGWRGRHAASVEVAPPAGTPAGLVEIISGCSLVIAHRLHACIAAHSFAIPTIGLRWDPKLDAFFVAAGRGDRLFTAGADDVATVVASAGEALAEGVDPRDHAALLNSAADDVARLAARLRASAP